MKTPILALAGGVGGAKLALGLSKSLAPSDLMLVVNTGDDEDFYGLLVSPDVDTVMYTLAGLSNPVTGWGLRGETFNALDRLKAYGEDTWFSLGDKDMATHIRRTHMMRDGHSLSDVTESFCRALDIRHAIVPMSDNKIRTVLTTDLGDLPMQTYFVKHRCEPVVRSIRFDGAEYSQPAPAFVKALTEYSSIVFCPSNPFVSVAPILSVRGVRSAIENFEGMRVAVSPIVGGQAIKGPAAKMMEEMGLDVSCVGVARQYVGLCDVFVIDNADFHHASAIEELGMRVEITNTIMNTDEDKVRLAQYIIGLTE